MSGLSAAAQLVAVLTLAACAGGSFVAAFLLAKRDSPYWGWFMVTGIFCAIYLPDMVANLK